MSRFHGWTLDAIVRRNGQRFPHKSAIIRQSQVLTWQQFDRRVDRVAHALRASGLRPGDRIALLMRNCPEYLELYFGIARAGMIAVPLNYRLTAAEMAAILGGAQPSLLVVAEEHRPVSQILGQLVPGLSRHWVVGVAAGSYEAALSAAPADGYP